MYLRLKGEDRVAFAISGNGCGSIGEDQTKLGIFVLRNPSSPREGTNQAHLCSERVRSAHMKTRRKSRCRVESRPCEDAT
jgi:hypothetical protein